MGGSAHATWLVMALAAAGCGRVGFDPLGGGLAGQDGRAAGDGSPGADTGTGSVTDASLVCADGDGYCPPGCVGMDTDCVAVCGDGLCVGNAGEKCGACAPDCATTATVCGNGACDPGEDGGGCPTDCGPATWPLVAEETALLASINAMRAGFTCPGDVNPTVSPPLTMGADPDNRAHQLAWHIAHQPDPATDNVTCNGTDYGALFQAAGYQGGAFGASSATASGVTTRLMMNSSSCRRVMMAAYTEASIGLSVDVGPGYMILLR